MPLQKDNDMEDNPTDVDTREKFRQKLRDPVYRRKFTHTIILFFSFVFLGLRSSQHTSAFLDLAQITKTNVEQASVFYTAMCAGSLVGNFCMGFMFDKMTNHRIFLLSVSCILAAATTVSIPWSTNYLLTSFIFFINQVFNGAFDTGGNASIISTWGVDGKMFMQFLHFSFSFGTIIAPFTVQPFLSRLGSGNTTYCQHPTNQYPFGHDYTLLNNSYTKMLNSSMNFTDVLPYCTFTDSRIHYAYLISGLLCLLSGIVLKIEGWLSRTKANQKSKAEDDHRNQRELPKWLTGLVLAISSTMVFFHCATGGTLVGYVMAFCVQELGWSKDTSAILNSVFSAGYAFSRLLGVGIVKLLSPFKMMLISNAIIILSVGGVWLSVVLGKDCGVWVCILFSAVGFALILPTAITYLENDVIKVTGKVASVIHIAGNIQGIFNPLLLGYLIQEVSSMWYLYLALIEGVLCFVFFGLLVVSAKLFIYERDVEVRDAQEPFTGSKS